MASNSSPTIIHTKWHCPHNRPQTHTASIPLIQAKLRPAKRHGPSAPRPPAQPLTRPKSLGTVFARYQPTHVHVHLHAQRRHAFIHSSSHTSPCKALLTQPSQYLSWHSQSPHSPPSSHTPGAPVYLGHTRSYAATYTLTRSNILTSKKMGEPLEYRSIGICLSKYNILNRLIAVLTNKKHPKSYTYSKIHIHFLRNS